MYLLVAVLPSEHHRSRSPLNESHRPDLLKELNQILRESAAPNVPANHLLRGLLITHHVIKELATVRLTRIRASFLLAAPEILATLQQIYFFKLQEWQSKISDQFNPEALHEMNTTERTLKVIRRLLVTGYDFPHRNDDVKQFWAQTNNHVQLYLQVKRTPSTILPMHMLINTDASPDTATECLSYICRTACKTIEQAARKHGQGTWYSLRSTTKHT